MDSLFLLASRDELIGHGLLALRECLPTDSELTSKVSNYNYYTSICLFRMLVFVLQVKIRS